MYRFFEKIFIICNFSVAFSNQKCYNTIIQFLFTWDLSYPTLFQSIAVFADLFLFPFLFPRRFPLRGVVFLFPINNTIFTQNVREKNISARPCGRTQKIHRQEAYCPLSIFYIYDMRSTDIMPSPPAPRRLTRPARALGNRHLIRLAAVRNESWDETPPYCA